jgi:hypothetical protein
MFTKLFRERKKLSFALANCYKFADSKPKVLIDPSLMKTSHNTAFLVITEPLFMSKLVIASKLSLLGGPLAPFFAIPLGFYNLHSLSNIFQAQKMEVRDSALGGNFDLTKDFKTFANFHSLMLSAGILITPILGSITNPVIIPSAVLIASTGWSAGRFCLNLRGRKTKGILVATASAASSWAALKFLSYSMFVALGPNPFVNVLEYNSVWGLVGGISFYFGAVSKAARSNLKKEENKNNIEIALSLIFRMFDIVKRGFLKGIGRG